MSDPITQAGAVKGQSRYAAINMGARQFSGLVTNRAAYRDGLVAYLTSKFYAGSRNDTIWDGLNREISSKLTDIRSPGSIVYNTQTFPGCRSFCSWKYIQDGISILRLIYDAVDETIYDATGPSTKTNIWNKAPNAGPTRFLGVNTELFFDDGVEQKKWVESSLSWKPNTLYDSEATSDKTLGDFIIDTNGNIQQAIGGFTLLIAKVSITGGILTLTLNESQLADPSGTPTGVGATTGGALTAGTHYIRIAGVDPVGNVTEAGSESAAVTTTGSTSQIAWAWPAISGAVSYRIYVSKTVGGEASYFTSNVNSFTQLADTSIVAGTPPTINSTSVDVPDNLYGMVGVELDLDGLTTATFLNGQTITIASVLYNGNTGGMYSNQITATFSHSDYAEADDTGTATSGTGITGGSQPSWATGLWAVTQDGGAQWINRGAQIENWGIATPSAAPTVFQSKAPSIYEAWQPNTTYWRSGFIKIQPLGVQGVLKLTQDGVTGSSAPVFDTTSIGAVTTDGACEWTYYGTGVWAAGSPFAKGDYVCAINPDGYQYIYQAQNAGTSGADQSTWTFGAGSVIQDNTIGWLCLGACPDYTAFASQFFTPSVNVSNASVILDSNGYLQQIQDREAATWFSGSSRPVWAATGAFTGETITATITQVQIAGGFSIITCDNKFTFAGGVPVVIAGLSVVTQLNGSWIIDNASGSDFNMLTPGLSPTAPTPDTGGATVEEFAMWLNIGAYAPVGTGSAFYDYSYKNSVTQHGSTASPNSAAFTLPAGSVANVAGFGSADPQVDTIMIFRTVSGGSIPILVDQIANPGGGLPWSYTDTIPDVSVNGGPELIAQIAAPTDHANDPPPKNMTAPAWHLQRVWAISGNKVVYSGVSGQIVGAGKESFPPANFFPFVAQPIRLVPITVQDGGLLVFTTSGIYIILGTGDGDGNTIPFYDTSYYNAVNLLSYDALDVYNTQIFLMEANNKVSMIAAEYPFNPQGGYVEVGQPIGDQFKKVTTGGIRQSLYDPATTYLSWNYQDTDETGMYVADGAVGWFRMGIVSPPESGLVWNTRRAITGGTSAVQSVETTPGKRQLLIGPPAGTPGPILARDAAAVTWRDRTQAYSAWDAKGVNLLCTTGQWAEVAHISAKSAPVGSRPTVSVLMNEIQPSVDRPYTRMTLDDVHTDPADTPKSISAYSDRYVVLSGNGNPATGDCVLTKFDYGVQDVGDELQDWGIYASIQDEREEQVAKG